MASPQTRYAKAGDVHVAYQVVGEGPPDLVSVWGWMSHLDLQWTDPTVSGFYERLASFSRLVMFDKRGVGLSDPVGSAPTFEERMDDIRAVMDAAGSERAALFGVSEGGPMCLMFAATYPERTSALALYGTFARLARAPDYPIGAPSDATERFLKRVEAEWGTGSISAELFAPSHASDASFRQSWARFERYAVSPSGIRALVRMVADTDARGVLSVIRAPTLVIHRQGDLMNRVACARYMAERIHGARVVELPGNDHFPWVGDTEAVLGEVEEFLTGVRQEPEFDRVLATVMFTDIVRATETAATLGDARWRALLQSHHALVRDQLARFRGREIDTAGDGFLASFDGPARAVRCASAVSREVRRLGLEVRAGLHTGECEVMGEKLGGIAVHTGARVASLASAGEVLVSGTVKDLVAGSGIKFVERGTYTLKGVPGEWPLYAVASA